MTKFKPGLRLLFVSLLLFRNLGCLNRCTQTRFSDVKTGLNYLLANLPASKPMIKKQEIDWQQKTQKDDIYVIINIDILSKGTQKNSKIYQITKGGLCRIACPCTCTVLVKLYLPCGCFVPVRNS